LADLVGDNDFFFIFTFDHGDTSGAPNYNHSYLCMNDQDIEDEDFADDDASPHYVGRIKDYKYRVFFMQQCYCGGFIDDLSNSKTVTCTGGRFDEVTHECDDEDIHGNYYEEDEIDGMADHFEFNFYWMSAFRYFDPVGRTVDADNDDDIFISIYEAYKWAEDHESNPETPQIDDDGNGQSQQDGDNDDGDNIGDMIYL